MRSVAGKLGLLLTLVLLLSGAAPAVQPEAPLPEALVFSAVDGSSWDADGTVDGVWTWAEPLTLERPLTCGDEPGCSMALVVAGDLAVSPGAGIESSGTLRLAVEGELRLARDSFLASQRGAVEVSAVGDITIDGLVSASGGSGRGAADRAGISLSASGGPGHGIRLGAAATLLSEGGARGGNVIQLAGCGIDVMGLVAAVASGPGAAVEMRSCAGLRVDGRDLGDAVTGVGGQRRGRVEVRGGGGRPRISLSAAESVALDGTELRVGRGAGSRIEVVAEQGSLSWRRGRGKVAKSPDGASDDDRAAAGEPPGRIRLAACAGFDLAGAEFDPATELELVDACGAGNEAEESRQAVSLPGGSSESSASRATACTPDLVLSSQTVSIIKEFIACNSIMAEQFRIVPRGFVTFRAGEVIVLKDGFSVEGSAQFRAILDSNLNQPPLAQDDAFMIDEDLGAVNGNVLADNGAGVDSDPEGDPLTVDTVAVSGPASGTLTLLANGDFTYTANGDFAGVDMFEYEISDGNGGTDVGKVTITVDGVNDAPSFTKGGDQVVNEDAGAQTVNPWATSISPGPVDEAGQTVSFDVTNGNNALFSVQPAVDATGILTYTPAADANGVADVTIEAMDDGGTANGGVDTSAPQMFNITVTAVNDAPALDAIADPAAILEDAAQQTVNLTGIGAGGGETQVLTVTATSDNTALIPNPTVTYTSANATGSIQYTPVANQSGTATITVTVMDDGGTANGGVDTFSRMFTVTVTAVNDAPTLDAIADPAAILEDAAQQTVNLAGIGAGGGETQVLTVTATSDNPGLIPNPTVTYTSANVSGSLMYTPVADQSGTATITVTVMDDGGTANGGVDIFSRMFTVTVTAVNDAPTLDAIADPAAILEEAAQQTVNLAGIGAGGGETQVLTVTATSDNTGLIPNPTVTYTSANATGSLMYTPVADQSGTATITVTVMDDGGTANGGVDTFSRMFTVTVTPVNDVPTLDAIADPAAILEDAAQQTVNLAGIGAGVGETQVLTVTATSDNTALIPNPTVTYTSANVTGSLMYTPVADQSGTATITVTVTDDGGTANGGVDTVSRMFDVTVTAANDAPTLDAIADPAAILEDAAQQTVNLAGIGAGGGETQVLTVTATSDNPGLIPNPTVTYTSANVTGLLMYTPVADQSGTATITVTVMDDGGTANGGVDIFSRMFKVTVTAVNDAPTLDAIADPAAIPNSSPQQTVSFSGVGAGGGETQVLTVTATSDTTGLIPNPTVTYTSPNATGSLMYTPVAGQSGTATITVTVMDDGGTANGGVDAFSRMFTVTVLANQPPMITTDPIAYTTAGNTQLKGGSGAMATAVAYVEDADNIPTKAGVSDPDMDMLTYSLDSGPSDGSATVSAAGNFLYTPDPGFVGVDSFDYEVSDGVAMLTGTVNVTVKDTDGGVAGNQVIWYVENDAAGTKDGTSANPFDTLKDAESMNLPAAGASDVGDTIFVLAGDGTASNQDAGLILDDDQKLIGHAQTTLAANGVTIQTPTPGARPKVDNTAGAGVTAADVSVEIRSLELTGSTIGIEVDATSGTRTVAVADSNITGTTSGHGIDVSSSGTGDLEVLFDDNVVVSGDTDGAGTAFFGGSFSAASFTPGSGTLTVSSLANNGVADTVSSVETGLSFTGVTFDADTSNGTINTGGTRDTVMAGALVIGDSGGGLRAMGPGLVLSGVNGDLAFASVDIFNSGGTGIELSNGSIAAADFALTIDAGTIDTVDGGALDLDPATVDITLASVSTSGAFATPSIRLVDLVNGPGGIGVDVNGGTLAGSATTVFLVGDGSAGSGGTASIAYDGAIAGGGTTSVMVQDRAAGAGNVTLAGPIGTMATPIGGTVVADENAAGTLTFSGNVYLSTGASNAVSLTDNTGATVSFSGDLEITTATGTGFQATGGGTVNVTGTSTSVTVGAAQHAVDLNGITIGAGDITFGTIQATATTAEAIDVDSVSNAGTFLGGATTISGAGSACIDIAGATSADFSFSSLTINGCAAQGIHLASTSASGDFSVSGTSNFGGTAGNTGQDIDIDGMGGSVTLNAVNIDNRGAEGIAITGTGGTISFGATTVDNQASDTTAGVSIASTTGGSVTFASLTLDNNGIAADGVNLSGNAAPVNIQNGGSSITGSSAEAFQVSGGAANVDYAGTITNTVGRSVDVRNRTGGTVSLAGAIDDDGTGIFLDSNGGGTVNFRGGLDLDTGGNTAFTATTAGTVNVCADSDCSGGGSAVTNTITTTTATALRVDSVNIGSANLIFRSITTTAAGSNAGIVLSSTGTTGGLVVTGDGATGPGISANNGSGGTISNKTGDCVTLTNTAKVSLSYMDILDCDGNGINGTAGVNGFVLRRSDVTGHGDGGSAESPIRFRGLTGTADGGNPEIEGGANPTVIANCLVADGDEDNIQVKNETGTLARFVVRDSTIGSTNFGTAVDRRNSNDGINFEGLSSGSANAVMNLRVEDSVFIGNGGDHVNPFHNGSSGSMDIDIIDNELSGTQSNPLGVGGGITIASNDATAAGTTTVTYNVDDNDISDVVLVGIDTNLVISSASMTMTGTINDNRIGNTGAGTTECGSGSSTGVGIRARSNRAGTHTVAITNNTIRNWTNGGGITLQQRDGNGTLNGTVTGNTMVLDPGCIGAFLVFGSSLQVESGATAGDAGTLCAAVGGAGLANTLVQPSAFDPSILVLQEFSTTMRFPSYGGAATNPTAETDLNTYMSGRNTMPAGSLASDPSGPFFQGNINSGVSGGAPATCP